MVLRSPGAMALAATNSTEMAELVNVSAGREMQLAGVNWAFSPVCDINSDPRNPVIGMSSSIYTIQFLNVLAHSSRGQIFW